MRATNRLSLLPTPLLLPPGPLPLFPGPARVPHALRPFAVGLCLVLALDPARADRWEMVDLGAIYQARVADAGATEGEAIGRLRVVGRDADTGRALLWDFSRRGRAEIVDLSPAARRIGAGDYLIPTGLGGDLAAGIGIGPATEGRFHALLWDLSDLSRITAADLHRPAAEILGENAESYTNQVHGRFVVGDGHGEATGGREAALAWDVRHPRAPVAISLHFSVSSLLGNEAESRAVGISDRLAVGYGSGEATGFGSHALLWNLGDPRRPRAVDLDPSAQMAVGAASISVALSVAGWRAVGYGYGEGTAGRSHALLWNLTDPNQPTASSLHAPAAPLLGDNADTAADAVSGPFAVGAGSGAASDGRSHALLWDLRHPRRPKAVDLHAHLGPRFVSSAASGVNRNGDVTGTALDNTGTTHAFLLKRTAQP